MRLFNARRWAVAAFIAGLAILVLPAAASASPPAVTFTNVSCSTAGYSFTATGTGFPLGDVDLWLHVYDNLNPTGIGQPNPVPSDASGSFTLDFHAGPGQTLPATVTVTEGLTGTVLAGPYTVAAVGCGTGRPSGLTTTITANPTSIPADGKATSTITVQAKDFTGANETTGGASVTLSTTLGTLGAVSDNGNGTYTATVTAGTTPGPAVISGTINGESIANRATVTFTPPPLPTTNDQCTKGGWQGFNGVFKNQGDCVSFVATHGKNEPGKNIPS